MGIKLKVIVPRGEEKIMDLCDTEEQLRSITVLQLKEKIREELKIDGDILLAYCGRCLEESALLSHYGIRHMSVIYVVLRIGGTPVEPKGAQQLDTSSTDMGIKLRVNGVRGEERIINLCDTEEQLRSITVLQLEEKIREELKIDGDFRLVHKTECLKESALLSHYGIRHMSNIFVLLVIPG